LGRYLQAQGRLNEGMQHLRTAVRLKPKGDSVRFNLGAGLLAVGQPDAAIREFRTAIALNPENADAHFNLGVILGPRNQLDAAITHLQRAVEINPLNADAHHNLGSCLRTAEANRRRHCGSADGRTPEARVRPGAGTAAATARRAQSLNAARCT
jgi:tetratricopeptide (TPR) repeat protein